MAENTAQRDREAVILLHGLARTARSMGPMARALERAGYRVVNRGYPSRRMPVEALAPLAVDSALAHCGDCAGIHFVTHSMGGILLRHYLRASPLPELGRVVMLAPPNGGSEVVDRLRDAPGFGLLNGPAGRQLGTAGLPPTLGAVDYPVGVVAGTRSVNPLLSLLLPKPNDGKVSVAATRVEGMCDFIAVPNTHPFIMRVPHVIEQTLAFLATGRFLRAGGD